jgi:hypothetical protein
MVELDRPKFHVGDRRRTDECHSTFSRAISQLIDEAVAMGWRREEVALQVADAADDYVIYLASNTKRDELSAEANENVALANEVVSTETSAIALSP